MSYLYDALQKATGTPFKKRVTPSQPRVERAQSNFAFIEAGQVRPKPTPLLRELLRRDGPWAEQFRTLREKLRSLGGADTIRRLGIVSAAGGEGKTTIAIALSIVLAEEASNKVLLVDADLRHRDVGRYLGINKENSGLADWLQNPERDVEIQRVNDYEISVLVAGHPSDRPWELITSPHLESLLDAARKTFDYVLIDCPPQGPVSDTARIQEYLDGLLFVVRARTAPRETILGALGQLDDQKILGVVFNDVVRRITNYHHYGYSYYRNS